MVLALVKTGLALSAPLKTMQQCMSVKCVKHHDKPMILGRVNRGKKHKQCVKIILCLFFLLFGIWLLFSFFCFLFLLCFHSTYFNPLTRIDCEACGMPKDIPKDKVICPSCTYQNPEATHTCEVYYLFIYFFYFFFWIVQLLSIRAKRHKHTQGPKNNKRCVFNHLDHNLWMLILPMHLNSFVYYLWFFCFFFDKSQLFVFYCANSHNHNKTVAARCFWTLSKQNDFHKFKTIK